MENCKKCVGFTEEMNELYQSTDDILIEGEEMKEHNFCNMYDNGITEDIENDKAPCKYFVEATWRSSSQTE